MLSDYTNPSPSKTINTIKTEITSEGTNSDSLPPSRQGDSTNMSSSNDKGQVTAVIGIVRYNATKHCAHQRSKQPGWHCSSDQILRVLLDSGSDGDLMFHEKRNEHALPLLD